MAEKCFCHLNGYAVKDATARQEIETLKQNKTILENDWTIVEAGSASAINTGIYEVKYSNYESEVAQVMVYNNASFAVYIGHYAPGTTITTDRCLITMSGNNGQIVNNSSTSSLQYRKIREL